MFGVRGQAVHRAEPVPRVWLPAFEHANTGCLYGEVQLRCVTHMAHTQLQSVARTGLLVASMLKPGDSRRWRDARRKRASVIGKVSGKMSSASSGLVQLSSALVAFVLTLVGILQMMHREVAPFCAEGAIITHLATSLLKKRLCRVLPEALWRRPASSSRDDPGFPSNHTAITAFVSVYFSMHLWLYSSWPASSALILGLVPPVLCSMARIWDDDHTEAQTFGGMVWGIILGVVWTLLVHALRIAMGGGEVPVSTTRASNAASFIVGVPLLLRSIWKRLR